MNHLDRLDVSQGPDADYAETFKPHLAVVIGPRPARTRHYLTWGGLTTVRADATRFTNRPAAGRAARNFVHGDTTTAFWESERRAARLAWETYGAKGWTTDTEPANDSED